MQKHTPLIVIGWLWSLTYLSRENSQNTEIEMRQIFNSQLAKFNFILA